MSKKTILLIEDNPKIVATINGALSRDYNLTVVDSEAAAADFLSKKSAQLILIDFDLKPKDGLQVFRELKTVIKTVMFSASNNIPLAVLASKAGIVAFLRKPLNIEELKEVVGQNVLEQSGRPVWPKETAFLRGESPELMKMFNRLWEAIRNNRDIVLLAETGVPKASLVDFIHLNSAKKKRQLMTLDLKTFEKEDLEIYFWSSLTEMMSLPNAASLKGEENRCGTLYLENIEVLDSHFVKTIFDFFRQRRPKIDKSIQVIIGCSDENLLQKINIKDYSLIRIPALRERKEDLPYLIDLYLKKAAAKYNKEIEAIETGALKVLMTYDFPGNYVELEKLVQTAVLTSSTNILQVEDFPFDFNAFVKVAIKKGLRAGVALSAAKQQFERSLYDILLAKTDGDQAAVAGFLDLPKSNLLERLENLMD